MRIAVTGATGFLGHYLLGSLVNQGHQCQCWYRPTSNREKLIDLSVNWIEGDLSDSKSICKLIEDADVLIHAGLERPAKARFQADVDLLPYLETNFLGTMKLLETARKRQLKRVIYLSTCAVHDLILDDRALDEAHPLWPKSVYGAHKAAIEKLIHALGLGHKWPVCALRPSGIYGLHHHVENTKWYKLVKSIHQGLDITPEEFRGTGGKEVHAEDVVKAIEKLMTASDIEIAGQAFNCYDQYISEYQVAHLTKRMTRSHSRIDIEDKSPKHQIVTEKIQALGMSFGGLNKLEKTINEIINSF